MVLFLSNYVTTNIVCYILGPWDVTSTLLSYVINPTLRSHKLTSNCLFWLLGGLVVCFNLIFKNVADDPKKIEYLLALDGAKERLSLFEANLLEEGSFESAVNDCECVFHTASPVLFSVSDPQVSFRYDVLLFSYRK